MTQTVKAVPAPTRVNTDLVSCAHELLHNSPAVKKKMQCTDNATVR